MICYQPETPSLRPPAEARAHLMGLRSRARVLTKALNATQSRDLACLYAKAVRVVHYDIAELEAA